MNKFSPKQDCNEKQSWNRYLYVENNPVNLIDPSGLKTCFEAECSSSESEDSAAPEAAQRSLNRWDSIMDNGYDPESDRFVNDVTITYTTGITGSGLVGGTIVLHQPTLDEVFEVVDMVRTRIVEEQDRKRREVATAAIESTQLGSFATNLTPAGEGFRFEVDQSQATKFQNFLKSNFLSGSLYGLHSDDVGCDEAGAQCRDYRSPQGSLGISGSMQVVYNAATGFGYIDVDRFNPYQGVRGFLGHTFLEVLGSNRGSYQTGTNLNQLRQLRSRFRGWR